MRSPPLDDDGTFRGAGCMSARAGLASSACLSSPVIWIRAANPSFVPGQCARTASSPARRTTLRSTSATTIASSA
jgi:hypothetical protein